MDSLVPFETLLARMRADDSRALDEFCRRYEPFLRRVARRWLTPGLRRHADSEDLVQSTLRRALVGLPGTVFENEQRFLAWLGTILRHRVSHLGRRERPTDEDAPLEALLGESREQPTPEESAMLAEATAGLKAALDRLPPAEREVVLLRDFEGLPFAEVARRLKRPSADAAQHLHARAHKRLLGQIDGTTTGAPRGRRGTVGP